MLNKDKKTCTCEVCGTIFKYVHGYGVKICSKECLSKLRSSNASVGKKVIKVCKNCGNEYRQPLWKASEFCSRDCYWKYRKNNEEEFKYIADKRKEESREIRKCEICGKEFTVYKKSKKRFCSDKCRKEYQKSDEFKKKRINTMVAKYGVKSIGNLARIGIEDEKAKINREKKYKALCAKSDVTLIQYISRHVLLVKCNKCGTIFQTPNLSYISYDKIYCKHCSDRYKDYLPAKKICNFLDELGINYIKNDRTVISPLEIDIFIPNKNIGIEVNGNFWHSEIGGKDKNYHINKSKLCEEKGIKLIHIFEDEIENKFNIVKSRLSSILGKTENIIYARKCTIKEVSSKEKKEFINKSHIQGDSNSSINIGLYYNEELVSIMTFSKERIIYKHNDDSNRYELIRFCNELNTTVVGGFSRLLKHFINEYKPKSLKTYCDIRWSGLNYKNTVYYKNGFNFDGYSKPNYWYMQKNNLLKRYHRYNFTKHSILSKHKELDKNKTEWELMLELGYNRIYDCGNIKFSLEIS